MTIEELKQRASTQVRLEHTLDRWSQVKTGFMVATLALISVLIISIFWAIFFETPPLVYKQQPFIVASDREFFRPGEMVPLKVERCSSAKQTIVYHLTRTIKNVDTGVGTILESTDIALDPGCKVSVSVIHVLPKSLPEGRYTINGVAAVKGLVTTHYVSFSSEPFQVKLGSDLHKLP